MHVRGNSIGSISDIFYLPRRKITLVACVESVVPKGGKSRLPQILITKEEDERFRQEQSGRHGVDREHKDSHRYHLVSRPVAKMGCGSGFRNRSD